MGNRIGRANQRKTRVKRRLFVEQLAERRVLAAITGAVFEDLDLSQQQEVGEPNVPRRLVYIDTNDNAQLDNGESFVVAEEDGTFEFLNLADGSYLLRLFNGTQTQTQTVPFESAGGGEVLAVSGAVQLEVANGESRVLTNDSVVIGDLQNEFSRTLPVGDQLARMQTLPDGTLLVISDSPDFETSWIVDPDNETVDPIDLSGAGDTTAWSDLEIDANGRGVLLEQSSGVTAVRAVDASDPFSGVEVTNNCRPRMTGR